jgi:hypothetical protein
MVFPMCRETVFLSANVWAQKRGAESGSPNWLSGLLGLAEYLRFCLGAFLAFSLTENSSLTLRTMASVSTL